MRPYGVVNVPFFFFLSGSPREGHCNYLILVRTEEQSPRMYAVDELNQRARFASPTNFNVGRRALLVAEHQKTNSISSRFTTIFCEDSALVLTWLLPGTIASAPPWVACVRVLCPILPVTIFFLLCALPHLSFLLSYFLFFCRFFAVSLNFLGSCWRVVDNHV